MMRVTVAVVRRGACGVPCAQERASLPIGFGLGGVVGCLNALVGSSRRRRRPKSEANARRRTTPRPSPQPLGWWLAWGPALGPGAAGRVRWGAEPLKRCGFGASRHYGERGYGSEVDLLRSEGLLDD